MIIEMLSSGPGSLDEMSLPVLAKFSCLLNNCRGNTLILRNYSAHQVKNLLFNRDEQDKRDKGKTKIQFLDFKPK